MAVHVNSAGGRSGGGHAGRASKPLAGRNEPAPAIASHCRTSRREEPAPDSRFASFFWSDPIVVFAASRTVNLIGAPSVDLRSSIYFQPNGNLHLAAPANNAKVRPVPYRLNGMQPLIGAVCNRIG